MPEHLTTQQIESLLMRRLPPPELIAATSHLSVCDECRQRVVATSNRAAQTWERTAQLRVALRADVHNPHLRFEQLAAYVENEVEVIDREIIVNHLESCSQCAHEAKELQDTRASLLLRPYSPPTRQGWLPALIGRWHFPALLRPLPLAAAVAAMGLLLAGLWWSRTTTELEKQVVTVSPSPVALPSTSVPLQPSPAPIETPAIIAALTDNGRNVTLDQKGALTGLPELSKEAAQAVKQALEAQKVEPSPELQDLIRRPANLMSDSPEMPAIKLLSPVGTLVKEAQPRFRWQPLPGAQSYVVTLLDENFNVLATSAAVAQPSWRAPQALKRGQHYVWQVTAEVDGKKVTSSSANAPEAHFKILSADQARALQALPNSHLLRGTLYAKAGLLDEAEREYRALWKANPRSSVARKLYQNLRALRRKAQ